MSQLQTSNQSPRIHHCGISAIVVLLSWGRRSQFCLEASRYHLTLKQVKRLYFSCILLHFGEKERGEPQRRTVCVTATGLLTATPMCSNRRICSRNTSNRSSVRRCPSLGRTTKVSPSLLALSWLSLPPAVVNMSCPLVATRSMQQHWRAPAAPLSTPGSRSPCPGTMKRTP